VKRTDHVNEVRQAAAAGGVAMTLVREGSEHEIWECGGVKFQVPRHRELTPGVVSSNRRKLAAVLGEGWWRR